MIGADTAERLIAPKYYGDDEVRMGVALEEIAKLGAAFWWQCGSMLRGACAR